MILNDTLPRRSPAFLKALVFLLVFAIFIITVLLARAMFFRPNTPRTAVERAIFDAEAAVRKDPRNAKARTNLGMAYAMAGNYSKAISELNTSLKLDPNLANTYYVLGVVYRLKGDLDSAANRLERAVRFEGEFSDFYSKAYYELGQVYLLMKKYNKAVKAFEQARANAPMAGDILYDLARAYEKAGEKESAIDAYWRALQYDPQNKGAIEALRHLGATEALRDLGIPITESKDKKKK